MSYDPHGPDGFSVETDHQMDLAAAAAERESERAGFLSDPDYRAGGYENAPATKLLATHCCMCSRPLVDAESVEAGIGPDCRKKHGYTKPDREVDLASAAGLIAAVGIGADEQPALPAGAMKPYAARDARGVANVLVHQIAVLLHAERADLDTVVRYVNALSALGYDKLSAVLSIRLATVEISERAADRVLIIKAPYRQDAVDAMKRVPGRRWDREAKVNTFPCGARRDLFKLLTRHYPNTIGLGPKGLFVFPSR